MGKGAASMAALSRQIEAIPDESVAALVRWFVPRAEELGGEMRFYGTNVQLSARIRNRKSRGKTSSTLLAGTPASAWSIKSYGRKGDYVITPRKREALRLSSAVPGAYFEHVHIKRATSGDGRWDTLVREADARFPDVVAMLVDRSIG